MLLRFVPVLLLTVSTASAADIRQMFVQNCALCHGSEAGGSDRGPALRNSRQLRTRTPADIANIIRRGTTNGMPPMPLPDEAIDQLAQYVHSLNATAYELKPDGDLAAGERFFFGKGKCADCHMVDGRGVAGGPDLSNIGQQITLGELEQSLADPSAVLTAGYARATVTLKSGAQLEGFARNRGSHDIQLQTAGGKMHFLTAKDYTKVSIQPGSSMPPLDATPTERANLIAWLSRRIGEPGTALAEARADAADFAAILNPAPGNWPSYYGRLSGNRYSELDQITPENVSRLQLQWIHPMPYQPLEGTPLVVDGMMFFSGPNMVHALDARTGREIWRYVRPRNPAGTVSGDAAIGANRGPAISGDRVFFNTDNAHMVALHRLTGAVLWEADMPETPSKLLGATSAPLVVNDLVISGVGGGDSGIRGFLAAFHVATGKLAWRHWTVPKPGEPGSETWKGEAIHQGGAATWLTGTYDPETGLLYWPTGNPWPDTDGTDRQGDNLYTDCVLALDPKTGERKWHFQFTPHDLHDWDANQPPVLVNAKWRGRDRQLLLQANRNGYFYVLDRTNGDFLMGKPFVSKLTWSSGLDEKGRPILTPNNATTPAGVITCPAVRGATNWFSTAYNPLTNLFYVMSIEDCSIYKQAKAGGFLPVNNPADPAKRFLRAIDIENGDIVWEIEQIGPMEKTVVDGNYSGALTTKTKLVFYGESSGGFAAVDAATGKTLWHFEAGAMWKASPMTYSINGRQYVAVASGANILSFALPE
jgi:PQQ-dependent dehydrogenase (methanol/ethanol family)